MRTLLAAIKSLDIPAIEELIAYGIEVNLSIEEQTPAIHKVLELKFANQYFDNQTDEKIIKVLTLLLTAKADPNTKNRANQTPLEVVFKAHRENRFLGEPKFLCEVVKLLLNAGADVNVMLDGENLLHFACRHNLRMLAELVLDNGLSIYVRTGNDKSALDFALSYASQKIKEQIDQVDSRSSVKWRLNDFDDNTPLLLLLLTKGMLYTDKQLYECLVSACFFDNVELVDNLLARKVSVYQPEFKLAGVPVHFVKSVAVAKLLIEHGTNLLTVDADGQNLLHYAIKYQAPIELIKFLIVQGNLPVNATNNQGQAALHYAVENLLYVDSIENAIETLYFLLDQKTININLPDRAGRLSIEYFAPFPYSLSIKPYRAKLVLRLWDQQALALPRNSSDLLLIACQDNNYKLAQLLLARGTNIHAEAATPSYLQPLYVAASSANTELLELLITAGADVNQIYSDKQTALHGAAMYRKPKNVVYLIAAGADIHVCDRNKRTALRYALDSFSHDKVSWAPVVDALLKAGAKYSDPDYYQLLRYFSNQQDKRRFIALCRRAEQLGLKKDEILLQSGFFQETSATQLHWIHKVGFSIKQPHSYNGGNGEEMYLLEYGYMRKSTDLICNYLAAGAELYFPTANTFINFISPLHAAAELGYVEVAQLLLDHGFPCDILGKIKLDFFSSSSDLYTPLQIAVRAGQTAMVELLLKTKANVKRINKYQQTLLHVACAQGHQAIVQLLLDCQLEIDAVDINNKTPLALAVANKHGDIITDLLVRGAIPTLEDVSKAINNQLTDKLVLHLFEKLDLAVIRELDFINANPLSAALRKNNIGLASELIERSASMLIHCSDIKGITPLLVAVQEGNKPCFEQLVVKGADVNARDHQGYGILAHATLCNTYANLGLNLPVDFDGVAYKRLRLWLIKQREFQNNDYNNISAECAYKLLSLFSTDETVISYVEKYSKAESRQPIHDLCLFILPVSSDWNKIKWAELALKYGPEITEYLPFAPQIQHCLQRVPDNLDEIEPLIKAGKIHYATQNQDAELAKLFVRYKIPLEGFNLALIYRKKIKKTEYLPELSVDGSIFGKSTSRYYFKKLPKEDCRGFILGALTNCCQSIGNAGSACAVHGMTSPYGGFYVVFKRISPAAVKHKEELLSRAKQAKTFADFINSKPKLRQDSKEKYNRWKATLIQQDDQSVLDVLRTMLQTELAEEKQEEIAAQCWAWLSADNCLVFDSWECKYKVNNGKKDDLCELFLTAAAKQAIEKFNIHKVMLGAGGQTPKDTGFKQLEPHQCVTPKDYTYYRDSGVQLLIAEKSNQPAMAASAAISLNLHGFFQPSTEVESITYTDVVLNKLLTHYCATARTNLTVLEAMKAEQVTAGEIAELLKSIQPQQLHASHHVVLPMRTQAQTWIAVIFKLNEVSNEDIPSRAGGLTTNDTMQDQNSQLGQFFDAPAHVLRKPFRILAYLDPALISNMPNAINAFQERYSYIPELCIQLETEAKDTGLWIVEMIKHFAEEGYFKINPSMDKLAINNEHMKVLADLEKTNKFLIASLPS